MTKMTTVWKFSWFGLGWRSL